MVRLNFIDFHQELCLYHGTNHKVDEEDKSFYLDPRMLINLGLDQVEIHRNTNFDTSKLTDGVSHTHNMHQCC
jgi:hypothetical protein